jgi:hypothetical protein
MKIPEPNLNDTREGLMKQHDHYIEIHDHIIRTHDRVYKIGMNTYSICGYWRAVKIGRKLLSYSRQIKKNARAIHREFMSRPIGR